MSINLNSAYVGRQYDRQFNVLLFIHTERDVYYFSKHVPKDIRSHYKRDRIVICLKTKSQFEFATSRACKSLIQRLEDYWMSLRLSTLSIPAKHLLKNSITCKLTVINRCNI